MTKLRYVAALLFVFVTSAGYANSVDKVTTYQDDKGWKLIVNGKDYYVKGMVWGYTPRGQNWRYSLWNQPDEYIRTVLDQEFTLLKAANVNTIRSFSDIPPQWVSYIYEQYQIMSIINPLFGRYGISVNGVWHPNTKTNLKLLLSLKKIIKLTLDGN